MKKTMWEVIKESKAGNEVLDSGTQYRNLENILATMDKENVQSVYNEWSEITRGWSDNLVFNLLHEGNGGFVGAGDDGFYMDFANWLVAQGEELYNAFQKEGTKAVEDYVNEHMIGEREYLFECMIYAFHPYID
ncbi:DUF4240 domain-containing protein [Bacillus mycoides]|uniref:DUF4240 domain-containing protein n=1 Tax=Bacillus mycoides TaxID=1405 RepID=UPI003A80B046